MNRRIKTNSGKVLHETSAGGAKGVLIRSREKGAHQYSFRVYREDGNYSDYKLSFEDLPITIDEDALASFYADENGELYLDEKPETLGWEILETNN